MRIKKIGLLFGSFNPVHNGHLVIAQTLINQQMADEVWLVVSPQNPFKDIKNLLNQYDRLYLVQLALEDNPKVKASTIEFNLPKPSYTIDTLTYLQEKYPDYQFAVIMGEDNLEHLHKWKNYQKILQYYQIIVYPRFGYQIPDTYKNHPKVSLLQVPRFEISATDIRKIIQNGGSVRYLVPDSVYYCLVERKLYVDKTS